MTSWAQCMGSAAILVYHELISICQIQCYDRKNASNNSAMSSENLDKKKDLCLDKYSSPVPLLSDYATKLENHVKRRYLEKISLVGVDPVTLLDAKLDTECLPPIEATDLLCYLVLETSYYTSQQFKAFKSLEAYNQMVSGFITSVQGKKISGKYVVLSKVRHSQRMNEPPIPIWIIASEEGTVFSAHCMGCKAGLAESCSHIASVLFYIEAWTRIRGKLSCTQVKCTWLLPTYVNEVPYARARDINFKSAQKIKAELDLKIDACTENPESPPSVSAAQPKGSSKDLKPPTEDETVNMFEILNGFKTKPVILSLFQPYSDKFVSKSRSILTISDLYDTINLKLTYPELLKKCREINFTISDSEIEIIEEETRNQAKGNAFFKHRAGRIGASMSWSVAHTNPAQPSQSLIKSICYPHLFKFTSKATAHGIKQESPAIEAYTMAMKQTHKDFKVELCGMIIDKEHPWLHATPDFLQSCSCCGDGCGEVKCPYGINNCDFKSYMSQKNSCLEEKNGKVQLKRDHPYYYQVQQQLNITKKKYCDFVVCAFDKDNKATFFLERISPDSSLWSSLLPKLTRAWKLCILPEITARWYTRKCHMAALPQMKNDGGVCYCRKSTEEDTITCHNLQCPFVKFHCSCLVIRSPIPAVWYCPNCRLLPQFKKSKSSTKTETDVNKALALDHICICNSEPKSNERLLECHNLDCLHGKFFHLDCMGYKRMPNNAKTTWICNRCKNPIHKPSTISKPPSVTGGCTKSNKDSSVDLSSTNTVADSASTTCTSSSDQESDDEIEIVNVIQGNADKTAPLGNLTQADLDTIKSPVGWLTCSIIQVAHICLKQVNPLIEGFQRTTLGPVRNFDVMSSEFVQILHTGNAHWVCISSVGCLPGEVNLFDSLFHDIIEDEVEEQVKDLMADRFVGINHVPVQQQRNGSDCGVFAIAFATCIVYNRDPKEVTFDVPKMRLHLFECLQQGAMSPFPEI